MNDNNELNNIFFSKDDDDKIITLDLYSMEEEALDILRKRYPKYKIESNYSS